MPSQSQTLRPPGQQQQQQPGRTDRAEHEATGGRNTHLVQLARTTHNGKHARLGNLLITLVV